MTDEDLKEHESTSSKEEIDIMLKELDEQMKRLGNKFGGISEDLALPSMRKLLRERFGMEASGVRVYKCRHGESMEIDVLVYSNRASRKVYIVEVKYYSAKEGLKQMLEALQKFTRLFPEHRDKELYGILAFQNLQEDISQEAAEAGLYLASIHDDVFELQSDADFIPKNFQASLQDSRPESEGH